MKIGIYQFNPEWGQIEKNINNIESNLEKHRDVDLWVLPELCTTGYQFKSRPELKGFAEEFPGSHTSDKMQKLSSRLNTAIILGVAEKSGSNLYNSAAVYGNGNFKHIYRKIHLFDQEKKCFDSGQQSPGIFDIQGVQVGVMICFDWIFPETARSLALQGAQLIAHPANLVLPYCQDAMVTRSIENKVFTATANRFGTENRTEHELTFTGKSQVTDIDGSRLGQLSQNKEQTLKVDIDPARASQKSINDNNDLFQDRRTGLYTLDK